MQSKAWSQRELMLIWKQSKSLGYSNRETVQRGPFSLACTEIHWEKKAGFLKSGLGNTCPVCMRASPWPDGKRRRPHKGSQHRQCPGSSALAAPSPQLHNCFLSSCNKAGTHLLHFISLLPVKPPGYETSTKNLGISTAEPGLHPQASTKPSKQGQPAPLAWKVLKTS